MTIDDKIRDKKLKYDTNREAAKISALSFKKNNKYEYRKGEEIKLGLLILLSEKFWKNKQK